MIAVYKASIEFIIACLFFIFCMQQISSRKGFYVSWFYGLMLLGLALFALGWQQVIIRIPLTAAYTNKAITIVWALIFGALIFSEEITFAKTAGCLIVIVGVVGFAFASKDAKNE